MFSCGSNTKVVEDSELIVLDDKSVVSDTTFNIYDNLSKSTRCVPLEETPETMFRRVIDIFVDDGFIFVYGDVKPHGLRKFDINGKYITRIGEEGNANNEFLDISNALIDKTRNEILIVDDTKNCIIVHDYDGKYLRTVKMSVDKRAEMGRIEVMPDSTYLIKTGYGSVALPEFLLYDSNFENYSEIIPTRGILETIGSFWNFRPCNVTFCNIDGGDYASTIALDFCDTLFVYKDKMLKPKYLLSVVKTTVEDGFINGKSYSEIRDKFSEKNLNPIWSMFETEKYLIINTWVKLIIWDKKSLKGNLVVGFDNVMTPTKSMFDGGEIMCCGANELYAVTNPDIESRQYIPEHKAVLDTLPKDFQNPVVMIYNLK